MNKEQLQKILEERIKEVEIKDEEKGNIFLLRDAFELSEEEAVSMYLSNDIKDIEKAIYEEVD